jgi:tRNA A37 methylthiotransferase MiaB
MKTAHCVNLGCTENHLDGALIGRYLETNDWALVEDPGCADLIILNSCAFTRGAEEHSLAVYRDLLAARRPGARVVFAGCLPAINRRAVREAGYDDVLVTPRTLHRLDEVTGAGISIDAARAGCVPMSADRIGLSFGIPSTRILTPLESLAKRAVSFAARLPGVPLPRWLWQILYLPDEDTEFVRISVGCMNRCTFCTIPRAKGTTRSVPPGIVVERVAGAVRRGKRLIGLSCDELASYGQDLGTDIVALLDRLTGLPGDFRLILRNVHPEWMIRYWTGLAPVFARGRIAYLIMPVQSGSDAVLAAMNRNHTSEEYVRLVAALREASPRTIVRTHLIVGFPGETEEEFRRTVAFTRRAPVDSFIIHEYSEHEAAPAAALPGKLAEDVVARRARRLRRADFLNWLRPFRWLPLRP